MSSPEFLTYAAACDTFKVVDSVENLDALEAAEKAYFSAEAKATAEWVALDLDDDVRQSAEDNAYDTVSETGAAPNDRLFWLRMAIASADFVPQD